MNFTAKEIVSIIKSIEGSGITTLEYEGLKISAEPATEEVVVEENAPMLHFPEQARLEQIIREEVTNDPEYNDLQRQTMMIEDPVGFEKMMDEEGRHA